MSFLLRRKRQPSVSPTPQPKPQIQLNPQTQSPLFTTLPIELRLMIFSLALECPPILIRVLGYPRVVSLQYPEIGGAQVEAVRAARLISLLLTCRRAHAEALPVLYGVNTFSIGSSESILLMAVGVGAKFIRRLEFKWYLTQLPIQVQPPPPPPRGLVGLLIRSKRVRRLGLLPGTRPGSRFKPAPWLETWEAMRELESLQWLQIRLNIPYTWAHKWQEHESEILMPLKDFLKDGTYGELVLPWRRSMPQGMAAEDILKGWVVRRWDSN